MSFKFSPHDIFEYALTGCTFLIFCFYAYIYFTAEKKYGDKYLNLINTTRTLVLAAFLIFFYNPLRSRFDYGPSMPFFAFTAGITLLILLDKYDILNLVHFILYGEILPDNPKKVCKLVESNSK
jgi:uncharacterized membrane protein YjfL (UPF0719 family)